MKRLNTYLLFLLSFITALSSYAQKDSVDLAIDREKNDSVKFAMIIKAGKNHVIGNQEKAEKYAQQAMAFAKEKGSLKFEAGTYKLTGTINYFRGAFYKAIEEYTKAIDLSLELKDEKSTSSQYRNVALCYTKLGNHSKAADFYFKSLKQAEKYSDSITIANISNDLGNLFYRQNNIKTSRDYYIKSYNMYRKLKDEHGMAVELNNIGSTYSLEKDFIFALVYYQKSYEARKKIADTAGIISSSNNIALIYNLRNENDKALKYLADALKLAETIHYDYAIANVHGAFSEVYLSMKDYPKAAEHAERSLKIVEKIKDAGEFQEIHMALYQIYDKGNKPGLAMKHYRQYLFFRDSLNSQENSKKSLQLQMQYDFDKKQLADSIQTVEKTKLDEMKHQQEIAEQKAYMYGGVIGFALMIIVSAVSFKAYRQKRKDNFLITEQKLLVEEKQKEVLDSIYYARRIQTSLMPSEKYIERNLSKLKKW